MNEIPKLPGAAPDPVRSTSPNPSASPARPGRATTPAFEAIFERLTARAAELEEKSRTLRDPAELPGAVDSARASLEDALHLGAELLEAFRAAQQTSETER